MSYSFRFQTTKGFFFYAYNVHAGPSILNPYLRRFYIQSTTNGSRGRQYSGVATNLIHNWIPAAVKWLKLRAVTQNSFILQICYGTTAEDIIIIDDVLLLLISRQCIDVQPSYVRATFFCQLKIFKQLEIIGSRQKNPLPW